MTLNLSYKVRAGLYIFTLIGSPVIAYLSAKAYIGDLEVSLWLAEVSAVTLMAAFNTSPSESEG